MTKFLKTSRMILNPHFLEQAQYFDKNIKIEESLFQYYQETPIVYIIDM